MFHDMFVSGLGEQERQGFPSFGPLVGALDSRQKETPPNRGRVQNVHTTNHHVFLWPPTQVPQHLGPLGESQNGASRGSGETMKNGRRPTRRNFRFILAARMKLRSGSGETMGTRGSRAGKNKKTKHPRPAVCPQRHSKRRHLDDAIHCSGAHRLWSRSFGRQGLFRPRG
jgi:hypothetical protein